jgi:hypothetical protein
MIHGLILPELYSVRPNFTPGLLILQRLKCNRGPVVQDHYNLALGLPDHFQTIAQMAIEILNILCVKSMAGPKDFLLGY